jgi:hypothetical protein
VITRVQRVWIGGLLVLLLIPGLIGFDVWPLTGWRLFSLSRDGDQNEWALEALTPAGIELVDLEDLPLAFRNAAWPLDHALHASAARKHEICEALVEGVLHAVPEATAVMVVRLHRHMDHDGDVTDTPEEWVTCGA